MTPERTGQFPPPDVQKEKPRRKTIIFQLRKLRGLSQNETAELAGLSQISISYLENNGVKNPGYKETVKLAKTFGVGLHFLEGTPETRVFLTARAVQFQKILEKLPGDAANNLVAIALRVFPQLETPNLTYINIDRFLTPKQLGAKIRRLQGDQTQHSFAVNCRLSQAYISQLESGDIKDPAIKALQQIANGADVQPEKLLGIKTTVVPQVVTLIDHFFRSTQVSPREKRDAWTALLFISQSLNKYQTVQPASVETSPIPQLSPF